jgi:hypothetical protein
MPKPRKNRELRLALSRGDNILPRGCDRKIQRNFSNASKKLQCGSAEFENHQPADAAPSPLAIVCWVLKPYSRGQ